jgi:ferredoxin--NADP+ reductase
LAGSFGAADFVSWYNGHPDVPDTWPLQAGSVAVIGAGNVALDVTRMLIKHARTLLDTDISDNVFAGLAANPIRDIHLFARRGPADVRFSPMELRELGHQDDVDIVVDPADLEPDQHMERMAKQFSQTRLVLETMREWSSVPPQERTASRRVHLHFYRAPAAILGTDAVEAISTEIMAPDGYGHVTGTGLFVEHNVQAVYRAIGYASKPLPTVPFDDVKHTIPHKNGAVTDSNGNLIPGLYATGWIKRGPIGLIGSTKSDARQTIETLLEHTAPRQKFPAGRTTVDQLLKKAGVSPVDWNGWLRIDAAERQRGVENSRERIKITQRDELTSIGLQSQPAVPSGSQRNLR